MSLSLDPGQTHHFVRPDLGPNCRNYQQTILVDTVNPSLAKPYISCYEISADANQLCLHVKPADQHQQCFHCMQHVILA